MSNLFITVVFFFRKETSPLVKTKILSSCGTKPIVTKLSVRLHFRDTVPDKGLLNRIKGTSLKKWPLIRPGIFKAVSAFHIIFHTQPTVRIFIYLSTKDDAVNGYRSYIWFA